MKTGFPFVKSKKEVILEYVSVFFHVKISVYVWSVVCSSEEDNLTLSIFSPYTYLIGLGFSFKYNGNRQFKGENLFR